MTITHLHQETDAGVRLGILSRGPAPTVDGFDALPGQSIAAQNMTTCPDLPGNLSAAVTESSDICRLQGLEVCL